MSIEGVRDAVVIVAGFITALWTAAAAAVFAVLWFLTRKYLGKANKLLTQKGRPTLDKVHVRLMAIRDRTARLPGNVPLPEGTATPARSGGGFRLPWKKKKRRLLPFGR